MNRPPPPDDFDENPEWTDEMVARARPADEVVPPHAAAVLTRRPRGRPAGSDRERVTLRIEKAAMDRFREDGPGWQTRMNATLADAERWVEQLTRDREIQLSAIRLFEEGKIKARHNNNDATEEWLERARAHASELERVIADIKAKTGLGTDIDA